MPGEETVWISVLREKLDEVLQKIDRLEEKVERRIENEAADLHSRIEELDKRLRQLETQRWILGGAAVAGGTGGLSALIKMFMGG